MTARGLVIFDWDGTLVDSAARILRCFELAARDLELQAPDPEAVRAAIGLSLPEAFAAVMPAAPGDVREALTERYREHFIHRDTTAMPFFPGVVTGLRRLRSAGWMLAVATGKARRGLQRSLHGSEIEDFFTATRCADEAPSKPHPQMVFDILQQTGMQAEATLLVGDTVFDLEMARSAGVASLAVSYGAHPRPRLEALAPLLCADSFDEVVECVLLR